MQRRTLFSCQQKETESSVTNPEMFLNNQDAKAQTNTSNTVLQAVNALKIPGSNNPMMEELKRIQQMLIQETRDELSETFDARARYTIIMRSFNELTRRAVNPQSKLFSLIKDAFIEPDRRNADIQQLIEETPLLINSRDSFGYTPLVLAAREARSDVVKLLLDNQADVNAFTHRGDTALIAGAHNSNIVRLLVENKANVNHKANDNRTALHAVNGSLASTQILIDAGADINAEAKMGSTPLMAAVLKPGEEYHRILVINYAPNFEQMQPTEIVMVLKNKQVAAFWIEEGLIKKSSLSESDAQNIVQKLPRIGAYSFNRGLINEVISRFGLKRSESSLCEKLLIKAGADPFHCEQGGLNAFKFELFKKANALNGIPGEAYESPLLKLNGSK